MTRVPFASTMSGWTRAELEKVDAADELEIMSRRSDGSLRNPVTIWVARAGDDLYVRPVKGREGKWFRSTQVSHEGRIEAGGVKKDVTFEDADPQSSDAIDRAYRQKYRRYAASIVTSVLTPQARAGTLRLIPRESTTAKASRPASSRKR